VRSMARLDQTAIAQTWKSCAGVCAVYFVASPQALSTHILQSSPPPLPTFPPSCRIVRSKTRPHHSCPAPDSRVPVPHRSISHSCFDVCLAYGSLLIASRDSANTPERFLGPQNGPRRRLLASLAVVRWSAISPRIAAVAWDCPRPRQRPNRWRALACCLRPENAATRTQPDQRHMSLWPHDIRSFWTPLADDAATVRKCGAASPEE